MLSLHFCSVGRGWELWRSPVDEHLMAFPLHSTPARHFRARNKSYNCCNKLNAMECNWSAWMELCKFFSGFRESEIMRSAKCENVLIKHKCLPFRITNHETSSASCDMLLRTFGSWWKMLQFKHGTCCGCLKKRRSFVRFKLKFYWEEVLLISKKLSL